MRMKRFVYIDDDNQQEQYCGNRISNRKYTVISFLPKNLWEQFRYFDVEPFDFVLSSSLSSCISLDY